MNKTEYLLTCLMEECAEVQKECSKALRFGLDNRWDTKTKRELLEEELTDLLGIILLLVDENIIDTIDYIHPRVNEKIKKVQMYMDDSRDLGTLSD